MKLAILEFGWVSSTNVSLDENPLFSKYSHLFLIVQTYFDNDLELKSFYHMFSYLLEIIFAESDNLILFTAT